MAAILLFGPDALLSLGIFEPGARIGSVQLSGALQETLFTAALFGTILAIGWAGARLAKITSPAGTRRPASFLLGMGIGIAGIAIAVAYAFIAGSAVFAEEAAGDGAGGGIALLAWGCAVVLLQAWAEEYYFRGWLQPVLARAWGQGLAIVTTAFAFAALHFIAGAESPWALVNLMLGGLLFAMLAARGGGIAAATGAHFAWNGSEQLLFGLDPNPGVGTFGSVIDLDLRGVPLWGGSGEGLNASWPMMMALAVVLVPVLILLWPRRTPALTDA